MDQTIGPTHVEAYVLLHSGDTRVVIVPVPLSMTLHLPMPDGSLIKLGLCSLQLSDGSRRNWYRPYTTP